MNKNCKKGQLAIDKTVGWSIAIIALVVVIILFLLLKDKGLAFIDFIKNLITFGR